MNKFWLERGGIEGDAIVRAMVAGTGNPPISKIDRPEDFKPRLSHVSRGDNEWDDDETDCCSEGPF